MDNALDYQSECPKAGLAIKIVGEKTVVTKKNPFQFWLNNMVEKIYRKFQHL